MMSPLFKGFVVGVTRWMHYHESLPTSKAIAILGLNHKFGDHVVSAYLRLKFRLFTIKIADQATRSTADVCEKPSNRLVQS